MIFLKILCVLAVGLINCEAISLNVVIVSQDADYDQFLSSNLRKSLSKQAVQLHEDVEILTTVNDFHEIYGTWTIWPLIKTLDERNNNTERRQFDWLFVCEPTTTVSLEDLLTFLRNHNPNQDHFIGRALIDEKPTIIHHYFGFTEDTQLIQYPEFAAGFVLSRHLLHRIVDVLPNETTRNFAIDPKFELAKMILRTGVLLTDNSRFCLFPEESSCITQFKQPDRQVCKRTVGDDDVFYAVKTYNANHNTRIVVTKRTWATTVRHIQYFSDINDTFVPTISLGINNTIRGHCGKTEAILNYFIKSSTYANIKWLVIADDDTLLSTRRLHELLECYNPDDALILGERYGYGFDADGLYGYDYPTGGAGMVFSRKAVELLNDECRCPTIDSPDDMIIGWCAREQKIPVIHWASFHQAQPLDYSPLYLKRLAPISFHKFENIDPYSVYVELLDDRKTLKPKISGHEEL